MSRTLPLVACSVALLAGLAVALVPHGGAEPPPVAPLRVTSGGGVATAFAVATDRAVTVAHAVRGHGSPSVQVGRRAVRTRVLRVDRRNDVALLAVPGLRARRLEIAAARGGDQLRLVRIRRGRTARDSVRVRRAIVAHVSARGTGRPLRRPALELRVHVAGGDSGAPLLTDSGALAGVVFASSRVRPGTAYAVDASALRDLLGH